MVRPEHRLNLLPRFVEEITDEGVFVRIQHQLLGLLQVGRDVVGFELTLVGGGKSARELSQSRAENNFGALYGLHSVN